MWTRFQTSHRVPEIRTVPRDYPRDVPIIIDNFLSAVEKQGLATRD